MHIGSARDLKFEVLADVLPKLGLGPVTGLSIGIAPGTCVGDYRLAIRTKIRTDVGRIIDHINKRAVNETDFRALDPVRTTNVIAPMTSSRVLRLGASVGHFLGQAGTLGFFARRLSDDTHGFVSCNHVLAAEDEGVEGDVVLHPGPADHGRRPGDVAGYLDGGYPRLSQLPAIVDCAFVRLSDRVPYEPSRIGSSEILRPDLASPFEMDCVQKIGRTTGRTRGRVTAFELDNVDAEYSSGPAVFDGQIEIESIDDQPFTRPGDSGSLLFTDGCQPLGLIWASSWSGGRNNRGLTYANPIDKVLQALGVEFLT